METKRSCRTCGSAISGSGDTSLCPRCLLGLAITPHPDLDVSVAEFDAGPRRFFGDYELVEEIARGGMGVVYRARQLSLDRTVAVKMVNSAGLRSQSARIRFQVEAGAIASLDHPNIVSLYESGEHDGQLFFSMRFVSGGDFLELLQQKEMPLRERVDLLAKVARAVQHAHSAGVLHRDLKPSNILIDENGAPQLADFGLAKLTDEHADLTRTESVLGSPNYMAPEQAAQSATVTTSADVYSLGAILYQVLTGVPPFRADTALETMRRVVDDEPTRPSQVGAAGDADLEVVCLKCLEKQPARRYQTAAEFADELDLWLAGQPVKARRVGRIERLWRWTRRQPALAASLAATALLLVGVAVVSTLSARRIERATEETRTLLYQMQLAKVDELNERGKTSEAMALLAKLCRDHPDDTVLQQRLANLLRYAPIPVLRSPRVYLGSGVKILDSQLFGDAMIQVVTTDGAVLEIDQEASGVKREIFRSETRPSALADISSVSRDTAVALPGGTVRIIDKDGRDKCPPLQHEGDVQSLSLSPDGSRLATAGYRHAALWKLPEGERIWGPVKLGDGIAALEFNRDGTLLAAGATNFGGYIWRADTGDLVREFPDADSAYNDIDISEDRRTIAFSASGGAIAIWDIESGERIDNSFTHGRRANGVRISPDGTRAISYSADRTARIWDLEKRKELAVLRHAEFVSHAAFSPDGARVVTGCHDGTARVWDAATGMPVTEPMVQVSGVHAVAFGKSSNDVRTVCYDGTIWKWDAGPALRAPRVLRSKGLIGATSMSPGARLLAAGSRRQSEHGNLVYLIDPSSAKVIGKPLKVRAAIVDLAFNRDGSLLAAASAEEVLIWHTASRDIVRSLPFEQGVTALDFSPTDDRLAVGLSHSFTWIGEARDKSQEPILLKTGSSSVEFDRHGTGLFLTSATDSVELWTPGDGQWDRLVINSVGNTTRVSQASEIFAVSGFAAEFWSVDQQKFLPGNIPHFGSIEEIAFAPDGKTVATASTDKTVLIAEVDASGVAIRNQLSHTSPVKTLGFSGTGSLLATGTNDARSRIWDVETGLPVSESFGHDTPIIATFFDPNEKWLTTVTIGGELTIRQLFDHPRGGGRWLADLAEFLGRREADDLGKSRTIGGGKEFGERAARLRSLFAEYPDEPLLQHFVGEGVPAE